MTTPAQNLAGDSASGFVPATVTTSDTVDPGSVGLVYQTFVLTEILSTGTLQTGLIFELQWYPTNADGVVDWEEQAAQSTALDPKTIV